MVISATLPLLPRSTSIDYISESIDVCNNSDNVLHEISGCVNFNSNSEQSEVEPGLITDDSKVSKLVRIILCPF